MPVDEEVMKKNEWMWKLKRSKMIGSGSGGGSGSGSDEFLKDGKRSGIESGKTAHFHFSA